MEEFLKQLMGKEIDVSCGAGATVRGDVVDVNDGVLYLRDEQERVAYIAIEKIAVIWEVKPSSVRPGFVG
ncbi:MAG TPA: MM0924 family protein [Pyrinomonadaceae bacterium]|nr:MM0924 family protein [Pyrinomonadaceae bacterium]